MSFPRVAWAEVDLGAMSRNVGVLKALTPPATLTGEQLEAFAAAVADVSGELA